MREAVIVKSGTIALLGTLNDSREQMKKEK